MYKSPWQEPMSQQCGWGVDIQGPGITWTCESGAKALPGDKTRPMCKGENKPQIQIQIPRKIQTGNINQRNIVLNATGKKKRKHKDTCSSYLLLHNELS